ncbi:MAG: hypothetical protein PWP67_2673, partial [Clostridium butyricum]|nr:hypothetical protein [Clostridium butyricum]
KSEKITKLKLILYTQMKITVKEMIKK